MNNSEQIKDVFEKLEALKNNIDELKREIEELKYFNRVLSDKLREIPDFCSEKKITTYNKWTFLTLLKNLKPMNRLKNMNITVTNQSLALTLTDLGK